ncbi:TetR/AcrR family transcriptional regulator [Parvibaculum sp.]|uniref:TetR/AcrR family transcriptional regulator n=1 Tax=Parvibaculum sp. TaxID=2024848 RepID=UPI001B03ADF1|nr:TetR/AcrR family transcriptional regulator [Parvibaculum sp.]MBO6634554.1 TetR/AcrR family transcriptional regulator [Parvibaculum sp.]MBO6679674.1 TetR/AcrR family transcriptional regulator [Parvibaculum sp.]MBO6686447.1 TetR/AcrR family transcriptional regulator [Parvibaculum sp.]MBO6906188.1 TetR/AcrR family transcriptional regulator [Parvibaculum sp.]
MGLESHRRKVSSQKQASILVAARDNFLKNGYSRAGMAEIARDADVSTATLYKHFASKEALFSAVVRNVARSTGDYSGVIEPGDTAREVLYKLCRAYLSVQFDSNANALLRIVIAEVPGAPGLAGEMYEILGNRRNDSLMLVLDELISRGMLKPHDSAFGARLGAGMLKEIFVWPALFDADFGLPPDTDEKIHRVIDAYLALYGPESRG